ncbi:hypothetical protein ACA590_11605 [Lactiplantibacillus plantarum]|uniref:hypothetical protein n=1 Tax=Lactiplantibacillus plantarum TaxID=1590 RepID=UPI003C2635FB
MKKSSTWIDKIEKKFKSILNQPISMSVLLGFVLGATLPTYALLTSNKVKLGDVGEWLGAIATFFAVWVSLYLANKNSKSKLEIRLNTLDPFRIEPHVIFDIVNLGSVSASVRLSIDISEDFVNDMLDSFENPNDRFNYYIKLKSIIDSTILNLNAETIRPYDRIEIGQHNSISVIIDDARLQRWMTENSPIRINYHIKIVVENIDGQKLTAPISEVSGISEKELKEQTHTLNE